MTLICSHLIRFRLTKCPNPSNRSRLFNKSQHLSKLRTNQSSARYHCNPSSSKRRPISPSRISHRFTKSSPQYLSRSPRPRLLNKHFSNSRVPQSVPSSCKPVSLKLHQTKKTQMSRLCPSQSSKLPPITTQKVLSWISLPSLS